MVPRQVPECEQESAVCVLRGKERQEQNTSSRSLAYLFATVTCRRRPFFAICMPDKPTQRRRVQSAHLCPEGTTSASFNFSASALPTAETESAKPDFKIWCSGPRHLRRWSLSASCKYPYFRNTTFRSRQSRFRISGRLACRRKLLRREPWEGEPAPPSVCWSCLRHTRSQRA